jgi:hypothetical protein
MVSLTTSSGDKVNRADSEIVVAVPSGAFWRPALTKTFAFAVNASGNLYAKSIKKEKKQMKKTKAE